MGRELVVARELAPAGLRSGPKILGALRTPAGASSLATEAPLPQKIGSLQPYQAAAGRSE